MASEENKISVVVCTYNREKYLDKSISSLADQTLDKDKYEVVLVNNNSTDGTAARSKELMGKLGDRVSIRYFLENNQGLSYARNRGVQEAKFDLICFIDDDAVAEPEFLENILSFFNSNHNAAGIGGKIIPLYVDGKPKWMNRFMEGLVAKVDLGGQIMKFKGNKYPIGCNMTYTREHLISVGLFDPDLGRKGNSGEASEEKDIFLKIINLGKEVYYLPTAIVHHVIEKTRLEKSYISKISKGIGRSERIRHSKKGGWSLIKKYLELMFKFGASIVLGLGYLILGEVEKASAVVRFRLDVIYGWHSNSSK